MEVLSQCRVHRKHDTCELVFSDLWSSAWRSYWEELTRLWRSVPQWPDGSSIYLENTKHDHISRVDFTLITPLVLLELWPLQQQCPPILFLLHCEVAQPTERFEVWTRVQGLETSPAWLWPQHPLMRGEGFQTKQVGLIAGSLEENEQVQSPFGKLLPVARRSFSGQGISTLAAQRAQQSFELLRKLWCFLVVHTLNVLPNVVWFHTYTSP